MAMDLRALPDGERCAPGDGDARLPHRRGVAPPLRRLLARDPAVQRPDAAALAPGREAPRRALTASFSASQAVVCGHGHESSQSRSCRRGPHLRRALPGLRADVYRAALRKLGNAHDAEDVTQAAFADAYRAVLRGARPQSPRAWLLAISENVRRRRFRTAQRRPREELVDDADFPLAAELPYEQSRALTEALATLPPEQRRVFVLREIVGLSYDEIAEELDSTVGSVQMLLFRARRSLRDVLDPPTVAVRRPVFLPPLPGWVAGLWSRIEIATLTPRAAGAARRGRAHRRRRQRRRPGLPGGRRFGPHRWPRQRRRRAPAAQPAAAVRVAAKSAARAAKPPAVSRHRRPREAGGPAGATASAGSRCAPADARARRRARRGEPQLRLRRPARRRRSPAAAAAPLPVAAGRWRCRCRCRFTLPVPLHRFRRAPASRPRPAPAAGPAAAGALPAVVETAAGAAGAAGASAPPLPVPAASPDAAAAP